MIIPTITIHNATDNSSIISLSYDKEWILNDSSSKYIIKTNRDNAISLAMHYSIDTRTPIQLKINCFENLSQMKVMPSIKMIRHLNEWMDICENITIEYQ